MTRVRTGHAAGDEGVADESREHRHLALREVDQAHGVVDEDQGEREARVDAAGRDPAEDELEELLHALVAQVGTPHRFVVLQL